MKEYLKPSGVRNRWSALSKGAQIGIIVAIIAVVAIGAIGLLFYCIKQRRAGKRDAAAYEAQQNKEAAELLEYRGAEQGSGKLGYSRI